MNSGGFLAESFKKRSMEFPELGGFDRKCHEPLLHCIFHFSSFCALFFVVKAQTKVQSSNNEKKCGA